ncbi:MAG TPA: hypothetical protein VMN57_10280 [Anaerolineales bacterium]|nr:hypothetical protein [Anaerolineales bacterium]
MAVKILMTWDLLPGKEQDYFEFVVRDFIPGMQEIGLQPSDAWYTYYGDHPQIMAGAVVNSMDEMDRLINSDDWHELTRQLMEYVQDFEYKIVPARGGFQL